MTIKEIINFSEDDNYRNISLSCGSVFNTPLWLAIYGDKLKVFGIYDNSDKLIGSFFLYFHDIYFLKHAKNPPFSPFCGLSFINTSLNKSNYLSFEKSIMKLVADFIDRLGFCIITISVESRYKDMQPFFWKNFKVIPNYTYKINLAQNGDEIYASLSPERRNDITKAEKDNIITSLSDDFKTVKSLVIDTFRRKEKTIREHYLDKILFGFAETDNSFAFISYKDNKPLAASFCIHDRTTAYYLLGGYDKTVNHHGAGAKAIWESVRHAKKIGLSWFDFEGSMLPPVEKYFRGFGGDLVPYYTINKASIPLEIILKFISRERF